MVPRKAFLGCGATSDRYQRSSWENFLRELADWANFQVDQYAELVRVNMIIFQRMGEHVERIEDLTRNTMNGMATLIGLTLVPSLTNRDPIYASSV